MNSTRKLFLEERRTGIGGSDAPAICGKSKFATVHDVYMDKLGLSDEREMTDRMEAGIRLEPILAQWYAEKKGFRVEKPGMIRHPDIPYLICHLDGLVFNGSQDGPIGILEIKCADISQAHLWGESGTDQVPAMYNIQAQHNILVASGVYGKRFEWCDMPVLLGGNDFRPDYRVPRNDKLIAALLKIDDKFWNDNVLREVPPEIDGSEGAKKMLAKLYPHHIDEEKLADEKIQVVIEKFLTLRDSIAKLEIGKLEAENKIKEFMGLVGTLSSPSGKFTWRQTKDGQKVDYKALMALIDVPDDVLAECTTVRPGYRRFCAPRTKKGS